jgi:hypothetical protein
LAELGEAEEPKVDQMWRLHALDTKGYRAFSRDVIEFGKEAANLCLEGVAEGARNSKGADRAAMSAVGEKGPRGGTSAEEVLLLAHSPPRSILRGEFGNLGHRREVEKQIEQDKNSKQILNHPLVRFILNHDNGRTREEVLKTYLENKLRGVEVRNVFEPVEKFEIRRARKLWFEYSIFIALKVLSNDFNSGGSDPHNGAMKLRMNDFHRSNGLSPSVEIDQIWHAHVLDTRGYERFCRDVMEVGVENGYGLKVPIGRNFQPDWMIHHSPYRAADSDRDKAKRRGNTSRMYQETFGMPCEWYST